MDEEEEVEVEEEVDEEEEEEEGGEQFDRGSVITPYGRFACANVDELRLRMEVIVADP